MCDNSRASFFLVQVCMFVAATDHISLYMEFFPFSLLDSSVAKSPQKVLFKKGVCWQKKSTANIHDATHTHSEIATRIKSQLFVWSAKKTDSDKICCCYWVSKGLDSYKWS